MVAENQGNIKSLSGILMAQVAAHIYIFAILAIKKRLTKRGVKHEKAEDSYFMWIFQICGNYGCVCMAN